MFPNSFELDLLRANLSAEKWLGRVSKPLNDALLEAHNALISMGAPNDPEDLDEVYRLNDSIDVCLGAQLIAGQRFMTHVAARLATLASKVESVCSGGWTIPKDRRQILDYGPRTILGYTLPMALDHSANYYKHESEWGDPWTLDSKNKNTITAVRAFGVNENAGGVRRLVAQLGATVGDFSPITKGLDAWRESLLSNAFGRLQHLGLAPTLTDISRQGY